MEVPFECSIDLCFIQQHDPESGFRQKIERELDRLFVSKGNWYLDMKTEEEEGLDIAVAEVKNLFCWESDEKALAFLEQSIQSGAECWNHLQGYRIEVIPKEDAGCCKVRKHDR